MQLLNERERLSPTGYGNGIAIPHCRLIGLETPVLVLGIHPSGIEFGGVDKKVSQIFLLMLTCARDPSTHLKLLSSAAHILSDNEFRHGLTRVQNEKDIFRLLNRIAAGEIV
jgi:mannitol/fructose-specific phosphotransferase system IIA component (Ntr-type)